VSKISTLSLQCEKENKQAKKSVVEKETFTVKRKRFFLKIKIHLSGRESV
jgi:hypothetical protein